MVELAAAQGIVAEMPRGAGAVPFTAQTRMSGLDLVDGTQVRKGAASAVVAWIDGQRADGVRRHPCRTPEIHERDRLNPANSPGRGDPGPRIQEFRTGGRRVLGVVHLKDVVKDGLRERFQELRAIGIRTVMITGDNPLTAKAIAAEARVDDFLAEATPEDKLALIQRVAGGRQPRRDDRRRHERRSRPGAGRRGRRDEHGHIGGERGGNMVDLDSDPTKLIDIVRIGKQLLITRGALTTFSLANDIAKYFAIIPAMFMGVFRGLAALNIMGCTPPPRLRRRARSSSTRSSSSC